MTRTGSTSTSTRNENISVSSDNLASLFQPDTLLSAQYFDTLRRKTLLEPERRLVLAILDDAIACYRDNLLSRSAKKKRLFDEAEEWIVTPGNDWIFSFDQVCETLGFNPEYIRHGLLRWKEKHRAKYSGGGAEREKQLAS
jgi:hypothetical protein